MLDLVDDEATGLEGLGAVGRGNCDDHGGLTDLQWSRPVHRLGVIKVKALNGIPHDTLAFLLRHRSMGFILQAEYLSTLVVITHGALEDGYGTRVRIARSFPQGGQIDGIGSQVEHGSASLLRRAERG